MKQEKIARCATCRWWNPRQAELEYSKFYGICTSPVLKFTTTNNKDCAVLDRFNRTKKHMGINRFENQSGVVPIGVVEESAYCLVTADGFGCINHTDVE